MDMHVSRHSYGPSGVALGSHCLMQPWFVQAWFRHGQANERRSMVDQPGGYQGALPQRQHPEEPPLVFNIRGND